MSNLTNKLAEDETVMDVLKNLMSQGQNFNVQTIEEVRKVIQRYQGYLDKAAELQGRKSPGNCPPEWKYIEEPWYDPAMESQPLKEYQKLIFESIGKKFTMPARRMGKSSALKEGILAHQRLMGIDIGKPGGDHAAMVYGRNQHGNLIVDEFHLYEYSVWQKIKRFFRRK